MHTLPDGTQILIRPIEATDKLRLSVALSRLSRETIRARFLAAKPRLTSAELRYLTEIDGHDHIALVATLASDPESIVAVARCVRFPTRPTPPSSRSSWEIRCRDAVSARCSHASWRPRPGLPESGAFPPPWRERTSPCAA